MLDKKQSRREFFHTLATLGLTGIILKKEIVDFFDKRDEYEIFNKLSKYSLKAKHTATYESGKENSLEGMGVCLDDHYLSVAHIPRSLEVFRIPSPFGIVEMEMDVVNSRTILNGQKLEVLVSNKESDVFIAAGRNLKNYPYGTREEIQMGEDVYILGNPQLLGTNIRKGKVCDLDDYGEESRGCFGIDCPIIPGDSGSPVIGEDKKILGLTHATNGMGIGYVTKINNFMKYLNKKKKIE